MNTNDNVSKGNGGGGGGVSESNDFEEIKNLESELNNLIDQPPISIKFAPEIDIGPKLNVADEGPSSTWDGFAKMSTVNVHAEKVNHQPTMTKEELLREKFKYLRRLETLEGKGVTLTKKYNMDTPLCEMQGEYEMVLEEKSKHNSVKFQSNMMMAIVNGIEFLNGKFDPFDIKLDGWSEQINENISDYDDVFGELHEKYKNRASLAPELKLMFQLAGSGLMIHMTNTMFKSSMPGMDDILRQNPDLMKQFQNAAVKTMSENSPGFSGFVNSVSNDGIRPGNNNSAATMAQSAFDKSPARSSRPEMKGPSDINDILSGLKTRTINVENSISATNSNISLSDARDLFESNSNVKKSKRRTKSEKNTVSLDI